MICIGSNDGLEHDQGDLMKAIRWLVRLLLGAVLLVVAYIWLGMSILGAWDPPSGSRRRR